MMLSRSRFLYLFVLVLFASATTFPRASAQTAGRAEITQPARGEALQGLVTLSGTATHPSFVGYDLAFAYASDPTDTWFPLGEPVRTPVSEGRLALWDTAAISDGDYRLRLRVWLQDGTALVAIVDGLRVRNHTPVETSTPAPIPTSGPTPTPVPPTPTLRPTATPSPAVDSRDRVSGALAVGAVASIGGLGLLAAYSLIHASLRRRWGSPRRRESRGRPGRRRR